MAADYRGAMVRFLEILFDVHPCPDFRTPMAILRAERAHCEAAAAGCASPLEWAKLAAGFLNTMGDGHAWVDMPEEEVVEAPVWVRPVEGLPVVTRTLEPGLGVRAGDVLLTVDGREAGRLVLEHLATLSFTEAGWGTRQAVARLLQFPVGGAHAGEAHVRVAGADGRVRQAVLPLRPRAGEPFESARRSLEADLCRRPFSTRWDDATGCAVFTYRTCADRERGGLGELAARLGVPIEEVPNVDEVAPALFADLRRRGTRRLVLDVRGNGGGNSAVGASLYPYLLRSPMRAYGQTLHISRTLQAHYPWAGEFALGDHVTPAREYDLKARAAGPRFGGEVVVLIDRATFSSGEMFAADLIDNGCGVLVGEPTGCGGAVPGEVVAFPLPEVGTTLHVGCKLFRRAGQDQGPVHPHVFLRQTLAEFRKGLDPVMEYALRSPL